MRLGECLISSDELWPNSFLVNIKIIALHNCLSSSYMNDRAAQNLLQKLLKLFFFCQNKDIGESRPTRFCPLSLKVYIQVNIYEINVIFFHQAIKLHFIVLQLSITSCKIN